MKTGRPGEGDEGDQGCLKTVRKAKTAHTCDLSTQEAEARGSGAQRLPGQEELLPLQRLTTSPSETEMVLGVGQGVVVSPSDLQGIRLIQKRQLCLLGGFSDAEATTKMAPSKGDWPHSYDYRQDGDNQCCEPSTALVFPDSMQGGVLSDPSLPAQEAPQGPALQPQK